MGFPDGTSDKESACQCRRCKRLGFHPWVGKIPWQRALQPIPVFLPRESPGTEESSGLQSRRSQSWTPLKRLSTHTGLVKSSTDSSDSAFSALLWGRTQELQILGGEDSHSPASGHDGQPADTLGNAVLNVFFRSAH